METIELWRWPANLVLISLAVLLPIALSRSPRTFNRGGYFIRVLAVLVALALTGLMFAGPGFLIVFSIQTREVANFVFNLTTILLAFALAYFIRTSVFRLRDCGWNQWLAVCLAIPIINVGLFAILLLHPSRHSKAARKTSDVFD